MPKIKKKNDRMCLYYDKDRGASVKDRMRVYHVVYSQVDVRKLRRCRVVCPACKRRMRGWVAVGYDDELRYVVPKHKRKRWWR